MAAPTHLLEFVGYGRDRLDHLLVHMNERPQLGIGVNALNVHKWVSCERRGPLNNGMLPDFRHRNPPVRSRLPQPRDSEIIQ